MGTRLRAQDLIELSFMCPGQDPLDIMLESWANSYPTCFCGFWHDKPTVIFGVAPGGTSGVGLVWMLATDHIFDAARYVIGYSRQWVAWLNHIYPQLTNMCHADNSVSIHWLEKCGFTFGDTRVNVNGGDFVSFWRHPHD
jgi:hypothetical protein